MNQNRFWLPLGLGLLAAAMLEAKDAPRKCSTDPVSGVEVCQITDQGENMIGYYDIPLYSSRYNKILYLRRPQGSPPEVIIADPDGSHAEVVANGMDPSMSVDGSKVYYLGRSREEPGMDVISLDLATRRESNVTHVHSRQLIQYSPPSLSPKGNILVYSTDNVAHIVDEDGRGDTALQLDDPFKDDTFHRLRMSPAQPHLIFYNRNHRGAQTHPLFVYDTDKKKTYQVTTQATHPLWTPDGLHLAYNGGPDYHFHITRYDGSEDRVIDPSQREGTGYCTYSPEGNVLACANFDPKGDRYPMPASLFLLALDGSNQVVYLARHDAKQLTFWGFPALHFLQDRYHLIFRSDATGVPQVYTARLPEAIFAHWKTPGHTDDHPPKTGDSP